MSNDSDLLSRLAEHPPLLDVRAPIEFAKGSIPGATNIPLLNDDERAAVGTAYKQHGQAEAIRLGHSLVSGQTREQRIEAWSKFFHSNPTGLLYCFRGGLRSQSVQGALREQGVEIPLIEGGYKRVRQLLIQATEAASREMNLEVVTGFTGSGKTELLRELNGGVCDLEGLANHKGSAFGKDVNSPQPAQTDFENRLGLRLWQLAAELRANTILKVLVEDESRMIGYSVIPPQFFAQMSQAPIVLVERSRQERAEFLARSYVVDNFGLSDGEKDAVRIALLEKQILSSLDLIQRRLGGVELKTLSAMVATAVQDHLRTGLIASHFEWVDRLLAKYYDPLYAHHLDKIRSRILFAGSYEEVLKFLRSKT